MTVLDASAVLALLFREPGSDRVAAALPSSCISSVNLSEVAGRFIRDGAEVEEVAYRLRQLALDVVPFDEQAALRAAALLPVTSPLGLSLADRACLALARQRGLTALTTDRAWASVPGVNVELIR